MFGIGSENSKIDLSVGIFSLGIVTLTFYLSRQRIKWISQYSILLSLAAGWILFSLSGLGKTIQPYHGPLFAMPDFFAFGQPIFDSGLAITAVFITFLLITNMIASIRITGQVLEKTDKAEGHLHYRASGFTAGINQLLGGIFSAIGSVPISGAAGFIATTGITRLLPFIISSFIVMGSSFIPGVMYLFAALPAPVGYSVTFVIFANMIAIAFAELEREQDKNRTRTVIGVSLMAGVGTMSIPGEAFSDVPAALNSLLNNGLILGTLIAVLIDQFTLAKEKQTKKENLSK